MTLLSLCEPPVEIAGAAALEVREDGVRPRRLPEDCWHILDLGTRNAMQTPSGVRIALRTDAPSVALTLMTTVLHVTTMRREPPVPRVDLVVDGERRETAVCEGGRQLQLEDFRKPESAKLVPGAPSRLEFALPEGEHAVELWLPTNAQVVLHALEVPDGARVAPPSDGRRRWLHYGSSISHCGEATSPARTWPAVAARTADVHLLSLGFGGACHLDAYVARYVRDQKPLDAISLKVGINVLNGATMRERTFVPAVHGFLDTVRDGHPDTPILVVSPIFCPGGEDRPGPSELRPDGTFHCVGDPKDVAAGALTLCRMRELLSTAVEQRRSRGDAHLHYLDGLELFGPDDAPDLPDDLHPNGPGYERMGERFHARAFAPGGPLAT